ncbi:MULTISPECIES: PE-PGRS family protein [unclassified Streptomyces]|uniref:PE-PGRS family protein n=1 Tax=unclassified Streptomyces TaxID=2593676 RepID=UPI0036696FD2
MSGTPAPMRVVRAAMFAAVCVALGALGHSYMSGMNVPLGSLAVAFVVTGALAWLSAGRRRGPAGIGAALLGVQGALHLTFSAGRAHAPAAVAPQPVPGHHPAHTMPATTGEAAGATTGGPGGGAVHGVPSTAHDMPATADGAAGMHEGMAAMPDGVTGMHDGMAGMADGVQGLASMASMAGHGGFGMIAAHVLAGLFCAAWLARGEAAVFRLAAVLGATALLAARPLARALALVRARVALVPPPPAHCAPCDRPRRLRGAVHAHTAVRRGPPVRWNTRATAPGRPARA